MEPHDEHVKAWECHEFDAAWFDGVLSADRYFKMPNVLPADAAMLLCQFDPLQESIEDCRYVSNGVTGPTDLAGLAAHFEAVRVAEPRTRTLLDWLHIAREAGLKYHPWIDGYVKGKDLPVAANTMPAESQPPCRVMKPDAPDKVAEPGCPMSSPMGAPPRKPAANWIEDAQDMARAIIKRQQERDLYPDQIVIADEIAKSFRGRAVFGTSGKPITGTYIKRHALRGISSAVGKKLSTAPHQGK